MYLRSFGSDNHATVHPRILEALTEVNRYQVPSYGSDHWSTEVERLFKKEFGDQVECFLVFNGTAANVLSLKAMVRNYQSVFCSDVSHLFNDECGSPEAVAGVKLIPVKSTFGKITIDELEKHWIRRGDQHYSQSFGISLTQPTELGTVYSIEELKQIIEWSKKRKLMIHIDGARLANAAVYLKRTFKEITTDLGVDIISFGGSKNGLMLGEAVLINNSVLAKDFKYIRKQGLQLPSKSRFIAAQFLAYLNQDLWKHLASQSLQRTQELKDKLAPFSEIKVNYQVESNAIFPSIPRAWFKPLREKYFFYMWDERDSICRWMTSWDTTTDDIDGFISEIAHLKSTSMAVEAASTVASTTTTTLSTTTPTSTSSGDSAPDNNSV